MINFNVFSILGNPIKSDIITIHGALYSRLNVWVVMKENPQVEKINSENLFHHIKQNLLWSGVFFVQDTEKGHDFTLKALPFENGYQLQVFSSSESLIRTKTINFDPEINLEDEIITFINNLVSLLTGDFGILGTAITYAEKTPETNKSIAVINTHGKKKKIIIQNQNINVNPRWTPKSDGLIYTSIKKQKTSINLFYFKSNKEIILTEQEGFTSGGSWYHNGKDLIVSISQHGNPDLYLLNIKGKILKRLTTHSAIDIAPNISSDKKHILFVSDRSGTIQIYQMNLKTHAIYRMTFEGDYNTDPIWGPDGQYIIYTGRVNEKFQLFLMDKTGENVRQLTDDNFSSEQPAWSPDGRQIIYVSYINHDQKLFIVTIDGMNRRRLTDSGVGISESQPAWSSHYDWK